MNASVDNVTFGHVDGQKVFQYSLYILNGILASVGSVLIMVVILRNNELRSKDFYLLCGLAGGDMSQAIAFLYSGVRRMMLVVSLRDESVLVTPFDCMKEFYNSFFLFGQECSMLMTFCISLDRFLAVKAFNRYRTYGIHYARVMIAGVYVHCAVVTAVGWYLSYTLDQEPIYPLICFTPYAVPTMYYSYHGLAQLVPGLGSITLYLVALITATRISKSQTTALNSVQMAEKRRQAQLTKNVAVVVFYTFFSTTVPFGVIFFFNTLGLKTSSTFSIIAPYMWALTCFDGGMNVFIYARKYPKFRSCLKKLFAMDIGKTSVVPMTTIRGPLAGSHHASAVVRPAITQHGS